MRIHELERLTCIDRATIRFYEKEGLLFPKRSENGYRDYTQENADELKKIILLRQLDMSIDRIRMLQQGSVDFSETLSNQIRVLSCTIEEKKRAKYVCQALYDAGLEYRTINADIYLKLMREIEIDDRKMSAGAFQETLPREIHPWRRWFARTLDYMLALSLVLFLLIVVFRVRPLQGDFLNALIRIATGLALVPAEAYFLSQWGMTPGKLAMGIRLEYIEGGNLPFRAALNRSWHVFRDGMGLCIPFFEDVLQLFRYCQLTGRSMHRFARYDMVEVPKEMSWDKETEIIYTDIVYSEEPGRKRKLTFAAMILAVIVLGTVTGLDSIKPKYRGSELTVAQFAENYNSFLAMTKSGGRVYEKLRGDGTKEPIPMAEASWGISEGSTYEPRNFEYELENGILRSISITDSWDDGFHVSPLSGDALAVTASLLMAQDGCGISELREFEIIWEQYQGWYQADFTYENLNISWTSRMENCKLTDGTFYTDDDTLPSHLEFEFKVTILE